MKYRRNGTIKYKYRKYCFVLSIIVLRIILFSDVFFRFQQKTFKKICTVCEINRVQAYRAWRYLRVFFFFTILRYQIIHFYFSVNQQNNLSLNLYDALLYFKLCWCISNFCFYTLHYSIICECNV